MNRSIKEKAEAEVHLITLKLKNESRSRCLGQVCCSQSCVMVDVSNSCAGR